MSLTITRLVFIVAGLYDFIIGLVFLFFGVSMFEWAKIPQPDHWAYIQFGALMLLIFGAMFFAIASKPVENRNLIPYGILLKICYVSIVGYYWATTGCPMLFKPFLFIDTVLLVLFVMAYFGSVPKRSEG